MYKISVPVMNCNLKRQDRDKILNELRRLDAERVFLAFGQYETDVEKRKFNLEELSENCEYFKKQGFEVGAWLWTFWIKDNTQFRNMRSISGEEINEFMCPTDKSFVEFSCGYIKEIAKCGVDLIQFDDDFRYGFLADTAGCLCDGHIAEINRITGEEKTREELEKYINSGGKNKFRDAYLQANGDAFRNFARAIRRTVDEVNPNIRIGACACMSSWDVDGTDARELAYILAGNTKPFVRLIGAPYWAVHKGWGNCLQDVVELERMESAWTADGKIEIMAEGDVYPRPRYCCPASYLEGFDTAIRVSGCTNGIIKYGIDYFAHADYEKGYVLFHERNRSIYSDINRIFGEKASCGVRVYESMKKVSDMVMPTGVNKTVNIQDLFFSKSARTLAHCTVPTVYEGEGICGIVFDENARKLPISAMDNGLIIDLAAAEILTERGIDVGLCDIGDAVTSSEEHFLDNNNYTATYGAVHNLIKVSEKVEILIEIETDKGKTVMSYRYENADSQRFLVLNVNTRNAEDRILKTYERSRQYKDSIKWLSGKELPAYCYGHPSMYIQAKKSSKAMAVGLWNMHADIAIEPVIELSKTYSEIEFINCNGRLDSNKVYLNDILPFAFAGFEVK